MDLKEQVKIIEHFVKLLKENKATEDDYQNYCGAIYLLNRFFAYKEVAENINLGDKVLIGGAIKGRIGKIYFNGSEWVAEFTDENKKPFLVLNLEDYGNSWELDNE